MQLVNGHCPRAGPLPTPEKSGGILALDVARVTGFCAVTREAYRQWPLSALEAKVAPPPDPDNVVYGRKEIASSGASLGFLFDAYERWLLSLVEYMRPDWMVWEAPILMKRRDTVDGLRRLHGPLAIVEKIAFQHDIRCREVNISTIKKHVTGSGRADKALMIDMIKARGFEPQDDNVADAIGVADTFIAWRRMQS